MNWKTVYNQKLTTAESAVSNIKSRFRVVIGCSVGEPAHVVNAMVKNHEAYRDVEVIHMLPMGLSEYAQPGMEPYFWHNALFVGNATRNTVKNGHGDYTPCYLHQIPYMLSHTLKPDVAMIMVSPPDKYGYCSCGVSVDYTKTAAEQADILIAQVNSYMPRTHGDTFIHISEMDCIVEYDEPIIELAPTKITEIEMAISEYCSKLIHDGDCLQLGVGAIPNAVAHFLKDKKDLGIHSETFTDSVIELMEDGTINNSKKNINKGVSIATLLMGTRKLYDFVDDNPSINLYSSDYVNDPYIAGQNDNLVSINSCVQVDLLGQVCSEMIGTKQISGVGGQVDFVRAASISKGGRSIIAMPSTAAHGTISKIVPILDAGTAVTTSRNDVEYIITEYGIAHLKYQTMRERAKRLIKIAHPKFRDELMDAYQKRFFA